MTHQLDQRELIINLGTGEFEIRPIVHRIGVDFISIHGKAPQDSVLILNHNQFELAQQVYEADGDQAVFWESERTIDVIGQYLENWIRLGLTDPDLIGWVKRFQTNRWEAARAYWGEIRTGIMIAFKAGSKAMSDSVAPYHAAKLDIMEKRSPST